MKNFPFRFALVSIALVMRAWQPALAADQVVTTNADNGAGSLRQALTDVSSGGMITFNLSSGNETITITSELQVTKALTIDGANTAGSGVSVTVKVVSVGSSLYRVFSVNAGGLANMVNIQDMTLQGGHSGFGGAIYVANSTLNLNAVNISDSRAYQAGGIYVSSCNLNMTNCICSNNSTDGAGSESHGGFSYSLGSTITISSCTFIENSAQVAGAIFNGGVGGNLLVSSSIFTNNSGTAGGAIYNEGTAKIYNSTISGNTSSGDGGAIMSWNTLYVVSSTLTGNTAHDGGAVYAGGTSYFINSSITGNNSSLSSGGGIFENGLNMYILNSMVINNSASAGADIKVYSGNAYIYYSWYNGISGSINIQATAPNVTTVFNAGDLGVLADNGGPTQTIALRGFTPSAGTGAYVYYNSIDGYYFQDNLDSPVSHRLNSWATHPTVEDGDRITLDQRGELISTPPCMGAYDEPFTAIWTGSTSSDWSVASNWSPEGVPGPAVNVIIPDVTNLPSVSATVASPAICRNLTINADAGLSINAGKALTVGGTISNNAGPSGLYIGSDFSGSGSLIQSSSDVAATVSSYISGSSTLTNNAYHFVSIPVIYTNPTSALFMDSYLYKMDATLTDPSNSNYYGLWVNQGSSTTTPLSMNSGYMIYYPGDCTLYVFEGKLNTGFFSPSVSYGGDYTFNLVPNPYPSAINWGASSGWTKTNVGGTAWIWSSESGNYTALSGVSYVPMGQGFIVMTSDSSPVLSMDNTVCVHNTTTFYKDGELSANRLTLSASSNNYYDETVVTFDDNASTGFDLQLDGFKLNGLEEAPQLWTRAGDLRLCVNALPLTSSSIIIPVDFKTTYCGQVKLGAKGLESFDPSLPIRLRDKITGSLIDLRQQAEYTFSHDPATTSSRFDLLLGNPDGIGESSSNDGRMWISGNSVYFRVPALHGQTALLEIFNIIGQKLYTRQFSPDNITSINPALSGIIIVRLTAGSNVVTTRGTIIR